MVFISFCKVVHFLMRKNSYKHCIKQYIITFARPFYFFNADFNCNNCTGLIRKRQ